MHETQLQISNALKPLLKAHGYKKRRLTWHKQTIETILMLHVEKNWWGLNKYYFQLGIYLNSPDITRIPPHYQSQIQVDLRMLHPNDSEFQRICNFEDSSLTTDERIVMITDSVSKFALPWLESHSTLQQLSELTREDYNVLLPRIQIFRHTYDYLREMLMDT